MGKAKKVFKKALSTVFGSPDTPEVGAPDVAPVADEQTSRIAKERAAQRKRAGKGRASTFLSEGGLG